MSDPIEMRFSPAFGLEVKASGQGVVEGLASVFNGPPDSFGDVVAPGAFAKSIASHRAEKTSPLMLWAHDTARPVGRWTDVSEKRDGLHVRGLMNLKTTAGRDAWEHVRAGDVRGLSIGFRVPEGGAKFSGDKRHVSEVELLEVSLVAMPAQPLARVTETRSVRNRAEFRDLLRATGLPRRAAEKLASGGWPALAGETPQESETREIARQMRELAARIKA